MKRKTYAQSTTQEKLTALAVFAALIICSTFAMMFMFNPEVSNPTAKWTDRQTMSFSINTASDVQKTATLSSSLHDQGR